MDVLGDSAFEADVVTVVISDLEEYDLDQDLRLGPVQIGHDLADVSRRLLIGGEENPVCVRVNVKIGAAHLAVGGALRRGRSACA